MKIRPVSELSLDELIRQKKILTVVTLGAGVILCFNAGIVLYMVFLQQHYAVSLLLFGCIGSVVPGFIALKEINGEISRRKDVPEANAGIVPAG